MKLSIYNFIWGFQYLHPISQWLCHLRIRLKKGHNIMAKRWITWFVTWIGKLKLSHGCRTKLRTLHVFTAKTMVGGWRGAQWRMTSCVRSSVRQSSIRSVVATRWPTAASAHSGNRNYLQSWARDNLIALQQRQCDNVIELERQEQIWKMIRSRCLDGVAKTNRVLMQELTTLWRDNMVAVLSRAQLCLLYICSLSERVIVMASILEILPCISCNKLSNSDFYWRHTVPKIIWVSAKNRASHFWSICNVMYEYMTGF